MSSARKKIAYFLFILYLVFLMKVILFKDPWPVIAQNFKDYNRHSLAASLGRANFIPFKTCYYYLSGQEDYETGMKNLGGNILLFIPFGWLLPFSFSKVRKWQKIALLLVGTSFSFEFTQLMMAYGSFDVDDILLNLLGGLIGFSAFLSLFHRQEHRYPLRSVEDR